MKTLSFTVGLLLLITLYYCAATPRGVSETSPGSCCFSFFAKKIPKTEIISIAKTHSKCSEKAFVFNTRRGYICVSQTLDWAKKAYEQRQNKDQ